MARKTPKTTPSEGVLRFPGGPVFVSGPAPEPPRPLGVDGRRLWDAITAEFSFDDATGQELLAQTCTTLDRVEAMRKAIDDEGVSIVDDKGNSRAHPLLAAELAGRAFVSRSLHRLGLPYEPIKSPGRPPGSAA